MCLCLRSGVVCDVGGWGLGPVYGRVVLCYVCVPDYLCRLPVQISVYDARRIYAQLRSTQYSILFHLIDIGFLPYICLWQISQIQTCLRVVIGTGLVSTSLLL